MKFADRLYLLRTYRGLSQRQLEQKAGVAAGMVYKYEKGVKGMPQGPNLGKLAHALDVSIAVLLGSEPMPSAKKPAVEKTENTWERRKTAHPEESSQEKKPPAPRPGERLVVRCEMEFSASEMAAAWGLYRTEKKKASWSKVEFLAQTRM